MMFDKLFIVFVLLLVDRYGDAFPHRSSSKSSQSTGATYDQKQTGDYNIQLHLKDFNVIAVVADDSFGDLGDYDYNYDYSDLTIKPSSSTPKPPSSSSFPIPAASSTILTSPKESSTSTYVSTRTTTTTTARYPTLKPESYPIPQKPLTNNVFPSSLINNEAISTNSEKYPSSSSTTFNKLTSITPKITTTTTTTTTTEKLDLTTIQKLTTPEKYYKKEEEEIIVTTPKENIEEEIGSSTSKNNEVKKIIENLEIPEKPTLPDESTHSDNDGSNEENVPSVVLGEVMHYRKCSIGFARDKRGRCRRIRKPIPQLPFDLTRLASGFAAKFRRQESDNQN